MSKKKPPASEPSVDSPSQGPSETMVSLNELTKILFVVSILIILGISWFRLDFLVAVLLGIMLVGLNFS